MSLALIIILGLAIFDILLVAACIQMAGDCSREEEKVVHCENCKHWDQKHCSDGQGWCPKAMGYKPGRWYCAEGERKNNES